MGELFISLVGLAGILLGSAWLLEQLHRKDQHKKCKKHKCSCIHDNTECGCGNCKDCKSKK